MKSSTGLMMRSAVSLRAASTPSGRPTIRMSSWALRTRASVSRNGDRWLLIWQVGERRHRLHEVKHRSDDAFSRVTARRQHAEWQAHDEDEQLGADDQCQRLDERRPQVDVVDYEQAAQCEQGQAPAGDEKHQHYDDAEYDQGGSCREHRHQEVDHGIDRIREPIEERPQVDLQPADEVLYPVTQWQSEVTHAAASDPAAAGCSASPLPLPLARAASIAPLTITPRRREPGSTTAIGPEVCTARSMISLSGVSASTATGSSKRAGSIRSASPFSRACSMTDSEVR